eukprot:403361520
MNRIKFQSSEEYFVLVPKQPVNPLLNHSQVSKLLLKQIQIPINIKFQIKTV